jgi:outer membrane murein-binding lipoprotein Lpp
MRKLLAIALIFSWPALAQQPNKSEFYLQQMIAQLSGTVAQLRAAVDELQQKIQDDARTIDKMAVERDQAKKDLEAARGTERK